MNYLLPLIILIILACVYAGSLKNPKSRLTVVVVVLAFILVLCWLQMRGDVSRREGFMGFTGYAGLDYNMRVAGDNGTSSGCGGYNYADVNSQVGSSGYDNIFLKTPKNNYQLIKEPMIWNSVGDGSIVGDAMNSENFPTVDGKVGSPKSMFMFKNNMASPLFCPSTFSTSMGCVGTTNSQREMINGRQGNRTSPDSYPGM
jgi:hypothetical protein